MDILELIKSKENFNRAIDYLIENPDKVELLINKIRTDTSAFKFNCEKVLRLTSEKSPKTIYPYFDFFVELIDYDNKFLKYGGILTIANLTAADTENKFDEIFDTYYSLVQGAEMIPANNVIGSSSKIAAYKPNLTDRIVKEVLKVSDTQYYHKGVLSPECKLIASGEAISFFYDIYEDTIYKDEIYAFAEKNMECSRAKVKKLVEKFIKKYKKTAQ